ncbi:MAG: hypothetical protein CM1200mP38_2810 [Dehalococcoidia bacterium]|nr:MAG: hypothetical protein CM1200mP38_2810 [Dehalococcoidia bacterium]
MPMSPHKGIPMQLNEYFLATMLEPNKIIAAEVINKCLARPVKNFL